MFSASLYQGFLTGLKSCWSLFTGDKGASSTLVQPVASEKVGAPMTVDSSDTAKQLEALMILETFSFKDVQSLHWMGEQLENFRLVLKLNRQTLRDIAEHYHDLSARDTFPEEIRSSCKKELASFFRQVQRIEKNLEVRVTQIESLLTWLNEGTALVKSSVDLSQINIQLTIPPHSSTVSCSIAVYKSVSSSPAAPKLSLGRWSELPIRPKRKQYRCTLSHVSHSHFCLGHS
jgi:hypothetical protein